MKAPGIGIDIFVFLTSKSIMRSGSICPAGSVSIRLKESAIGFITAASARLLIAYRVACGMPFLERLANMVTAVVADDKSNFHSSQPW